MTITEGRDTVTEHPKLTLDIVRPVMDEIVKDNPTKQIDVGSCSYAGVDVHAGQPSCLVGHVLHQLGWSTEELAALDKSDPEGDGTAFETLVQYGLVKAERDVVRYLQVAQSTQDRQQPWLDAYRAAERTVAP